ncbi:Uncharacterised protein family UPF0592 [Plasmopara halstedii]|uniref:Uncharacterized protein family UPF0592 n=1 Tax=Plasmopara halstedii TaxID=4781 RepID=A0A0P1AFS2_PLAHL|nr:Uncharacterised protein family UPF0592 [Plasmopara halstedii]CEG39279.1 Uncharacterised protein family UPF0592 [Plasmopara halstedii]|eukprot:XP_024575648.1 Uncharacterised protein family UPF0592 [Plasmopara halstedii]
MADAKIFRTASLPEKARLIFNAQLHQQLKNIAKNREISVVPGALTISSNGSIRPTQPMALNGGGRSTELNGWNLDKKMMALAENLDLLRRPFFHYLDFGTAAAADASNGGTISGVSGDRKLSYHSYFNKMLPLHVGQTVLLDLWDYLMDMVDHVPVRNRCRALYLQAAVYICRRVEFIEGYPLDGRQVHLDSLVSKRYIRLLERSVQYCSIKIRKSRLMAEEHRFFVAHIYTAKGQIHQAMDKRQRAARVGIASNLRSPRHCHRHWNDLSGSKCRPDRISGVDLQLEIFTSFSHYKSNRNTDRLVVPMKGKSIPGIPQDMLRKGSGNRSIAASLEAIFQEGMYRFSDEQEVAFIYQLPLLYIGHKLQNDAFVTLTVTTQDKIEAGLDLFIERVSSPGRDDLMAVTFLAAVLNDVSSWCSHRHADGRILWHCVPGYFAFVRLYLAVFQRMCQRRARSSSGASSLPTVGRILSIFEGKTSDPWEDYWNDREIAAVLDAGTEVLKNEALINVLMQVILESTNLYDPASVNYSIDILQRVLVVASIAAVPAVAEAKLVSEKFGGRIRHCLGMAFDGDYFLSSMRSALKSSHVQTLLKILTCIYNCIDLLPTAARKRLVAELILRENFFRFFLHWNEEIRKIFSYMIVFKTSASNRLDLPSASDRILLAQTPFFEGGFQARSNGSNVSAASPALSYLSHLSELAQVLLRPTADSDIDPAKKAALGKKALRRLTTWDASARLKRPRSSGDAVFRDSLVDEELSVDLSIASKLDANFKMIAEQLNPANQGHEDPATEDNAFAKHYFSQELEAYAERALSHRTIPRVHDFRAILFRLDRQVYYC